MLIGDTDRDGNYEFIFTTYGGTYTIYFYELHLPSTWEIDSVPYLYSPLLWDIGDFDLDGFYDLVMQSSWGPPSVGIAIFESPDSFSYPTQEVWRDTIGFPLVIPICVYDVDGDGVPEIVYGNGNGATDFNIFESAGDNSYELIYTGYPPFSCASTFAFGDFDRDSSNEFVFGNTSGRYAVYECNGNNSYVEIITQQLSTLNVKDCFTVPDADGDGKLEFVVKGFVVPTARIHAFIFEATNDNTYEVIKSFDLFGGHNSYYGGYSEAGDVDGDNIPEIVLEGCQNIYIIKSAGNDSFYVWETLPGNVSGSCVRVFDIDDNGLSEIVISGNDETRIYEYEEGGIEEITGKTQVTRLEISPNPFIQTLYIKFQTQAEKEINVRIYDVVGTLVKALYRGFLSGHSTLTWNGTDDNGRLVPQGIYFLRVEDLDSGATSCKKVLKVR